jgi:hypothetical protein
MVRIEHQFIERMIEQRSVSVPPSLPEVCPMHTVISEFVSTDSDLGRAAALRARWLPVRPRAVDVPCMRAGHRRPRGARPQGAVVRYDRPRIRAVVDVPRGAHPMDRLEWARVGLATLAVAALLSAAVVCGLIGLAQLRAGGPGAEPTSVVEVREGESLVDVAARVAPGDPVPDTVHKIVELNGLRGAEVAPGRTLIVPAHTRW